MSTKPARSLHELAAMALAVLRRDGTGPEGGGSNGTFRATAQTGDGKLLELSLSGPDIPAAPPDGIAPPELVRDTMDWTATHTLKLLAPLTVFELAWRANEPPRIIAFSRGDWEAALAELAAAGRG